MWFHSSVLVLTRCIFRIWNWHSVLAKLQQIPNTLNKGIDRLIWSVVCQVYVTGQNLIQVNFFFNLGWFSVSFVLCPDYSWIRARRQKNLRINLGKKISIWIWFLPGTRTCTVYMLQIFSSSLSVIISGILQTKWGLLIYKRSLTR